MSNGNHWMPLYVADYLGDTMHLTTLQHGAYVLLLMHYWRTGPLPQDCGQLAAIAKLDDKAWKGVWPVLQPFFTVNGDGTLHQKRMDCERQRWEALSEKRREAGRRGAESKHRPGNTGPATPPPQPSQAQPWVAPSYTIPQPGDGKTLANAKQLPQQVPVDNLAIATILPDVCQPVSGNCHPFATRFASPPVPSKESIFFLSSQKCAREAKPGENEQESPREAVRLPSDAKRMLLDSLPPLEPEPKPRQHNHTLREQLAAVGPKAEPKANCLSGAQLAMARRQASIGVAP